ncbi:rod shape-determining protein MreC [candidate division KSB1 bacterium]|nr:rod shape-determining protein MreC [candidate division KSB1 bacterium]
MRSSPRLFVPRLDWIILLITVGFSLTLLFFSKSPAVNGVKRELGTGLAYLAKPLVQLRRAFDVFRENAELRELSIDLSRENGELRAMTLENERLRGMLAFRNRFPYEMLSASVIAHPGIEIGGKLIVDRGKKDGLRMNAAVVAPAGLVGKVVEVANHTALVQTLVGNTYGVSVMVERSRAMGILRWLGPGEWTIVGLATGEDITVGDLILTTGAGFVFPAGIRVGVVSEIRAQAEPGSGFSRVQPFVRFNSVEELFVVTTSHPGTPAVEDSVVTTGTEP